MGLTPTQKDAFEIINSKIEADKFPILLTGAAGNGKTTIVSEIMEKYGLKDLHYFDNRIIDEIVNTYKPFNDLQGNFDVITIIKNGLKSGASIFHLWRVLRKRKISRKRALKFKLAPDVYLILSSINSMLITKKVRKTKKDKLFFQNDILIFDEINFWNETSLTVLNNLLFNKEVREVFPNLKRIRPIVVYSPNYYISADLNEIINHFNNEGNTCVEVREYTEADLKELFKDLEEHEKNHILESLELIRSISLNSNIFLVKAVKDYILENKQIELQEIENIDSCFEKYFFNEDTLENVLATSTIPPKPALLREISLLAQKVHNYESTQITEQISKGTKKKIIYNDFETVNFIHDEYQRFFDPKTEKEKEKYYANYAEVLKELTPGDYPERAKYHKLAGNKDELYIYMSMEAIQKSIQDISCRIPNESLGNHREFVSQISKAYKLFYQNKKEELRVAIDRLYLIPDLPEVLNFEREYLNCRSKMQSGNLIDFKDVNIKMTLALKKTDPFEKEICVRAYILMYISAVYQNKKELIKELEEKILKNCKDLSRNNSRYDYYLYSINRRAIVSHEIETAYQCTKESVEYFEKSQEEGSSYFLSELFYSLVNHAATCRYSYKYKEALENIQKAYDLYENSNRILPGISMYNTYAIISFECGFKTPQECIETYLNPIIKDIDELTCKENTYYIVYNNIGCLYTYMGNIEEASSAFDKAFQIMKNSINPIGNHSHMLKTNKAVIEYLSGNKQNAISLITESHNTQTYQFSDHYLGARRTLLENIMRKDLSFSTVEELNKYMNKEYIPKNDCGKHFNRGLLLWSLEYWTK